MSTITFRPTDKDIEVLNSIKKQLLTDSNTLAIRYALQKVYITGDNINQAQKYHIELPMSIPAENKIEPSATDEVDDVSFEAVVGNVVNEYKRTPDDMKIQVMSDNMKKLLDESPHSKPGLLSRIGDGIDNVVEEKETITYEKDI